MFLDAILGALLHLSSSDLSNPLVAVWIGIGCILLPFVAWRLWRFSIAPRVWSSEPAFLPYWIPIFGHTKHFITDADSLFGNGSRYFGVSQPYALTIGGQTTVIVRDPVDLAEIWKQSSALSFDPLVRGVFESFGLPETFISRVFAEDPASLVDGRNADQPSLLVDSNPTKKCYIHNQSDWLKTQLLGAENLSQLLDNYDAYLKSYTAWDALESDKPLSNPSGDAVKELSLGHFVKHVVTQCSMRTFLGDKIFEFDPDFAQSYQRFEDESWKLIYRIPQYLAKQFYAAKDHAVDSLSTYLGLPEEKRPGLSWIYRSVYQELGHLDTEPRHRAGIGMLILWAINNNAHLIAFWILAHLMYNQSLLQEVCSEIDRAYTKDGALDRDALFNECPTLDAVWHEVLRVYINASAVRRAEADCTVGGKHIRAGTTVMAPYRQFLTNPAIFGPDALRFDPTRFVRAKSLHRQRAYAPFGGGHTYCPGRVFAQREVYLAVARLLHAYDFELVPGEQSEVPPVDKSFPAAAAMGPARDIKVLVRPRKSQ